MKSRVVFFLFYFFLMVVLALSARKAPGQRIQGSFRSHLYLREDRLVDPIEETFFANRDYLTLHVTDLPNQPNWSFHGSAWARYDFAERSDYINPYGDDDLESELLTGYLQWQDPLRPNTYMQFGRQFAYWGGINERFDGLLLSKEFESGNGLAVFGGIPTYSDYGSRTSDRVGGGRVWLRPLELSELGFSYVRREDDEELDREVFSQDFFWRPLYWVELEQHVSYDTITDSIVDFGIFGGFKFHPKAKFSIGYEESIPGALLPQTSFLSVFSNDKIQEVHLGLDFYPDRDWDLFTEAIYYDSRSPGGEIPRYQVQGQGYWEYRLGTRYYYGNDCSLSLEWRHLDVPEQGIPFVEGNEFYESIDNGYDRLRFTNHHWLNQWCWHSLEAGATLYRDEVNGSPHSYDLSSSWGYRPRRQLEAVATLRYIDSAVDNTEIQALLSVTYYFDKLVKNGATADLLDRPVGETNRWLPHTTIPIPTDYKEPW